MSFLQYLDRKADARSLEVQEFAEAQSFSFKEEEDQDTVPFLQMLQSEEPSFLRLLSLQNLKEPWEVESFLSQEGYPHLYQNQVSASYMEGAKQPLSSQEADMILLPSSSPQHKRKNSDLLAPDMTREKRKRRKTKPSKNIEEIESQRISHIVVERNRRRQMNEHVNSLRSLLPPSYIQRVISTTTKSTLKTLSLLTCIVLLSPAGRPSIHSRRSYKLCEGP